MRAEIRNLAVCAAMLFGLDAGAASDYEELRGGLLYRTHCIACHTDKVHWRDNHLATDWNSLVKQVDRWQSNAGLNWEQQDIHAVAHYLNALYYRYTPEEETAMFREATTRRK
jgi:mono/diheme cytochrome c family protein